MRAAALLLLYRLGHGETALAPDERDRYHEPSEIEDECRRQRRGRRSRPRRRSRRRGVLEIMLSWIYSGTVLKAFFLQDCVSPRTVAADRESRGAISKDGTPPKSSRIRLLWRASARKTSCDWLSQRSVLLRQDAAVQSSPGRKRLPQFPPRQEYRASLSVFRATRGGRRSQSLR